MKKIGFAIAILLLILSSAIFLRRKPPAFPVTPISMAPRLLTSSEVLQTLQSDLKVFRTVDQVPKVVKNDYKTLTGEKFWMVNPGQEMSTDMILPDVPNKRLVFLALGPDREVLLFERGGFVGFWDVIIAVHGAAQGAWCASLDSHHIDNLQDLNLIIRSGKFTSRFACFRPQYS